MAQQLQENRFELKYIIDEHKARAVRDFVRGFLTPDTYADPENNFSYPIHSVYLDNPSMSLFNATVDGHKNRFKLRVRYYDDNPRNPVFFEIKRRVNDAILKKRAAVRRDVAAGLINGQPPAPSHLLHPHRDKDWDALQDFCTLRDRICARGRAIVTYMREAWITSDNNSVRLTIDRELCGLHWNSVFSADAFAHGVHPRTAGLVLELKFTSRFPSWMREAAHIFNLQRTSFPKYVQCINAMRPVDRRLLSELETLLR